ncbi:hypothetical protein XENORESO_000911 [Xenotaenia resolanae]|uniref:Secreted protein n=1 Tax=Xenotaenia resolanae TaxID=208358 RepID=A0ABV0W481_9TELE
MFSVFIYFLDYSCTFRFLCFFPVFLFILSPHSAFSPFIGFSCYSLPPDNPHQVVMPSPHSDDIYAGRHQLVTRGPKCPKNISLHYSFKMFFQANSAFLF